MNTKDYGVNLVTDYLNRELHSWKIAGGFARDKFYDKTPRDLDIVVYGLESQREVEEAITHLAQFLMGVGIYESHTTSSLEYPHDRVYGVVKTNTGVDIIFWTEEFQTIEEVLEKFDFNINQFIILPSGEPSFRGANYGNLVQLRESTVSEDRRARMEDYAESVFWTNKPLPETLF